MRITNPMMTNRMLLNINRNVRNVDGLYTQLASGKLIQLPSDNPIVAARALKFRTNITETMQYKRNVDQGLSWMQVTESGFKNAESLLLQMGEEIVSGSSDVPYTPEDRKKIMDVINQMVKQMGTEMNVTYAGRYVFSGYRTNQPPVFETDHPDLAYTNITQTFNVSDVDVTKAYQRVTNGGYNEVVISDVKVLKLAYSGNISVNGVTTLDGSTNYSIVPKNQNDADAYNPADGTINYIRETGELVLGDQAYTQVNTGGLKIQYDKTGFMKGELNPLVYFQVTDANGKSYNMDGQNIEYEFGVNTRININSLAKNVYTDKMYADLVGFARAINDVVFPNDDIIRANLINQGLTGDELERAINDQRTLENQEITGFMQNRFKNMLSLIDKHNSNVSKEHADLGSRMIRLDLIQSRLEEDEINYTELLSNNEDVDYMSVMMNLNSAEAIYRASLQAGARIAQISLANYI